MNDFKKGLKFGIGLLVPILVLILGGVSVLALADRPSLIPSITKDIAVDQNTPTQYVWVNDESSIISNLSTNIASIRSSVVTKTYKMSYDGGKTLVDVPIIKNGYVITFKTPPLATDIDKLDIEMSIKGMKRDGGKTVIDKIADVKTTVDTLSTKVTALESKVVK